MLNQQILMQQLQQVRQTGPLVHCMTNDVVVNFTANVLLAIGASPAMVMAREESVPFARIASSLLVNVGTLTPELADSIKAAVIAAHEAGKPWVLDPVAYGVLDFRTRFCDGLLQYRPAVIRGNAAEIAAMGGQKSLSKGTDSLTSSNEVLECARQLARQHQTVVAMTGQTDYVTDGVSTYALDNGHEQLTRITGAGCSLSAMVAAYCAVCETPLLAALAALSHMGIAGELAAGRTRAVGSFAVALLDELDLLAQNGVQQLQCQQV
ncbi:Hydroxyethylthiazole kinase [Saezia sanguinis]|uniref:Hydroxyethylthiazole kinase n=1 Tax=Saezia sanguinis TaxID=1965230 RepID=A0A433SFM1_9BURK|nr:hydroxyethylthiazole kinase [Saezia sanguinis]RUS67496.1 Hydroxyethylthiazole kinase [Saezia sanguinis]